MEPRLKALGRRLAAAQDERLQGSFDFASARAQLLESAQPSRREKGHRAWGVPLAITVIAVAVAVVQRNMPLEFHVADGRGSGTTGEWIVAPSDRSVPITFSDGTALTLLHDARARVVDVGSSGATLIVERGAISASVVHNSNSHWRAFVGPFEVRVTGTEFDVGWQPETEVFSLTLRAGSVLVSGPGIDGERAVHAGENLEVSRRGEEPPPVRPDAAPAMKATETEAVAVESELPASVPERLQQVGTNAALAEFRKLAREGKYQGALRAAERIGFEPLCRAARIGDVMLLADAARLAGDTDRARQAYRSVRQRSAGQDSGQAAFFLGRIAFDQSADYDEAARYFALSIAEQPEGPLAREAAGRLIEARLLLGDTSGAREASRQYLERHADGPHAKTAKRVLGAH